MFEHVISRPVKSLLDSLAECGIPKRFFLAEGAGLALQLGHRNIQGLDLFTGSEFDHDKLMSEVRCSGPKEILHIVNDDLFTVIAGVSANFIRCPPGLQFIDEEFPGWRIVRLKDILRMTLETIRQRPSKCALVDLYFGLQEGFTLNALLDYTKRRSSQPDCSDHLWGLNRALELPLEEPLPDLRKERQRDIHWDKIHSFLQDEVRKVRSV